LLFAYFRHEKIQGYQPTNKSKKGFLSF